MTIRVEIPTPLTTIAQCPKVIELQVTGPVTQRTVVDALEARYPVLSGKMRDHVTGLRRPFVRFYACEEDLSHCSPEEPLPDAVANGTEPFLVIGAMAGG